MRETWHAIREALTSRLAAGSAAACVAATLAVGGALPLLEVPGVELGLGAALACALALGPALGIAAARRELARPARRAGPAGGSVPGVAPLRAFAAAGTAVSLLAALALLVAAARAALATPCRPLASAALFALEAFPSGLLAVAIAVAATWAARGRRGRAAALYAGAAAASLAFTLAVAYRGPAASAHDHLLGFWPGPIYDEAIEVDPRLLLFRLGTLGWCGAAVALAVVVARRRAGARVSAATAALAAALALSLGARAAGGKTADRDDLAAALGGERSGPRCTVHLPRERPAADAERILRDCEYDAAAVAEALGLTRPPRATVWLYRSAEEKRRLVGAGHTSFTKPWLAEVHVQWEGVPHPLLRHELVHALASAAARGPLRVPARAGVLVDAGLVEGLAVALEVPSAEHGVHAWARALRDQGRLPPLASLLGTAGFLGAAPARAYTAAGSFLRFLLERRGPAVVLAAYRQDDVAAATGASLASLDGEWNRFLDGVAVPPSLAAAAEARFERGSVFVRACAREVATLEAAAGRAAARGDAAASEAALRRAGALSGGDPAFLRGAADAWRAAGDRDRASKLLEEALARAEAAGGRRALRGSVLAALGDLALQAGEPAAAAGRYRAALALGAEGAEARTLRAKAAAADDPALRDAAAPWLLAVGDPGLALARLASSGGALPRYLLARARLARGAPALAWNDLAALRTAELPDASLAQEARRMAAEALCLAGRWDEGIDAWRALAASSPGDGDARREQAEDAARRCRFERDAYGAPIRWDGDWPAR